MPLTRAGVLGWPVRHSRSPAMHEAAYAAVGLEDWRYQLLPVPPPLLAETVRALPAAGFAGANVTIPHKEAALALADEAGPREGGHRLVEQVGRHRKQLVAPALHRQRPEGGLVHGRRAAVAHRPAQDADERR